jgi:hypothetical protein
MALVHHESLTKDIAQTTLITHFRHRLFEANRQDLALRIASDALIAVGFNPRLLVFCLSNAEDEEFRQAAIA